MRECIENDDTLVCKFIASREMGLSLAPGGSYRLALRVSSMLPRGTERVVPDLAIYHKRLSVTERFRSNLRKFTGIVLPIRAHTLEVMLATPCAMDVLFDSISLETNRGGAGKMTEDDVKSAALWLLNINALHFLQHSRPNKFPCTNSKLKQFNEFVTKNGFDLNDVVLDSSILLEIYGIRMANDIDYLAIGHESCSMPGISDHDRQLFYHGVSKEQLIKSPEFNFFYNGFRVVSFFQVMRFKKNRNSKKDAYDVAMMKAMEDGDNFSSFLNRARYEGLKGMQKTKMFIKKMYK